MRRTSTRPERMLKRTVVRKNRSGPWIHHVLLLVGMVIVFYLLTVRPPLIPVVDFVQAVAKSRWAIRPLFWGLLTVGGYLILAAASSSTRNPLGVALGADGRLSSSKFQFFLWTGVVLFTYVWLFAARQAQAPGAGPVNDLPKNVLLAMGFSITTLATAKGITVSYVNSGRVTKTAPETGWDTSLAGLVAGDDLRTPDLPKMQMLVWTLIAAVVYLMRVASQLDEFVACTPSTTTNCFPDIDAALMVLMGLGQGAYLGAKLATADTPGITVITPQRVLPGSDVAISGSLFGTTQGRSVLGLGRDLVPILPNSWSEGAIVFTVPVKRNDGLPWTRDEQAEIGLWIDGRRVAGPSFVTIAMPDIGTAAITDSDAGEAHLVLQGGPFGTGGNGARVLVDGQDVSQKPGVKWQPTQINIPKRHLLKGHESKVQVEVNGYLGKPSIVDLS
jgi:hypothetical protein